ncbi:MAG TPA: tetratricopeptide repeat protein [Planktothrix sp.]|jgi:Tfp pilus assembly protein PilF
MKAQRAHSRRVALALAAGLMLCSAAWARSSPDWDKLLSKGYQLMNAAKNKEAAAEFEKVVAKYPDAPLPHLALGRALKKSGQMGDAKSEFKKATEIDSNLSEAFYEYGTLAEADKQYVEAATAFERYLFLKPDASMRKNVEDRIRFDKQTAADSGK